MHPCVASSQENDISSYQRVVYFQLKQATPGSEVPLVMSLRFYCKINFSGEVTIGFEELRSVVKSFTICIESLLQCRGALLQPSTVLIANRNTKTTQTQILIITNRNTTDQS